MPIIATAILQHTEDASMLWLLRKAATISPHYSLTELAKLDGRVEAHLDGLRIAGEDGWQICRKELAWEEPGEVFSAGVLAFESGNAQRIEEMIKVGSAEPALANGLISALGWLPFAQIENQTKQFLASDSPALQRVGLAAFAVHRQNPGSRLQDALNCDDPMLKARACKAMGELGLVELLPVTVNGMVSDDAEVRFWAAWSAALLEGHAGALDTLRSIAESPGPRQEQALILASRRMEPAAAKAWQKKLAQNPETLRQAIIAAGAIGDPEFVPWLIGQMHPLPLARVAGEAFTMITGNGIAYQDLELTSTVDFDAGPTEDPEDENVAMDPDENLAWPDPALVEKWWQKHRSQFSKGTRHLCGKPITPEWLKQVLRDGFQRQRAAAALELAIRNPGKLLYNVKAPGFRQIKQLGKPGQVIR